MAISDEIIIMEKGVVAQTDSPSEIYYHPKNRFVADFIGEANFIDAKVISGGEKAEVEVLGERLTVGNHTGLSEGEAAQLVIRPEAAKLSDEGVLKGTVTLSTFMGAYQYYRIVLTGDEREIQITDYNPIGRKIYREGDSAALAFSAESVYIIPGTAEAAEE